MSNGILTFTLSPVAFLADGSLGDIAIITEFCENGDLKTYLTKRRSSFRNDIFEDEIVINENITDPTDNNNASE